jgi:hypothetical protein
LRPSFETLASQAPQDEVGDIFHSLEGRDPSVSAIAFIAAARTLVSALERRPFFTFEARGDGSLRSQGRLVERRTPATSGVAGIGFSALPPNPGLMLWSTLASPITATA